VRYVLKRISLSLLGLGVILLTVNGHSLNAMTRNGNNSISANKIQVSKVSNPILLAQSTYDSELLALTNAERSKAGLPALRLSTKLGQAGQNHAIDMVQKNFFSHTGSNGSQPSDRAKSVGYSYSSIGENIAAGNKTPAETIKQWMASPGHRSNILSSKYTEIGFGYTNSPSYQYKDVWVQVFGNPKP
jgi:uncharacterized protein YkwD